MTDLLLINEINKVNFQPEMFGGFADELNFIKCFYFYDSNIQDVFFQINKFLVDNGYSPFDFTNNWTIDGIENELMNAYGNPHYNTQEDASIILVIYKLKRK